MEEEDGAGLTGRSVAAADRPGGTGVIGLALVDSDSRFATSSLTCPDRGTAATPTPRRVKPEVEVEALGFGSVF